MFLKLLVVILVAGATACALLVNRQARIDTIHEISVVHHRLQEHEHQLWVLQTEIARRCRPDDVRAFVQPSPLAWRAIPVPPGILEHGFRIVSGTGRAAEEAAFGG